MADEQHRWLDSDAAERLLSGEPLEAVEDDTRTHAAGLAETLAALVPATPPTGAELPGEAAALAAFRAARTARDGEETAVGRSSCRHPASQPADAGLVRLGRRPVTDRRKVRWGRPVRFGLAAAVAAGMIGGVAVAAGSGVLPTPFHEEPAPAASVSAAGTPQGTPLSPTPGVTPTGGPASPMPDGTSGAPEQGDSLHDQESDGSAATGGPGSDGKRDTGRDRQWWTEVRSSCRDMAGGGKLGTQRMRSLEDAAGGSGRVKTFCKGVLGGDGGTDDRDGQGSGRDGDNRGHNGGGESDQSGGSGGDGAGDGEGHIWPGDNGAAAPPSATPRALAPVPPWKSTSPDPAYSSLSASAPGTPEG